MRLSTTVLRRAAPVVLAVLLSGCGGGADEAAETACPPQAQAAAPELGLEQVRRPVPKRDPRELDRMTAADAGLVSLLRSVEQGGHARPAAPAHATEEAAGPSCDGQPAAH